jgi:Na+/H+ antiporter NhaC
LLYPPGGALGAEPAILIAAVLGGATFGDNISPVSDTTIASATTQEADIGGVVRSRLKYALPAGALALGLFVVFGGSSVRATAPIASEGGLLGLAAGLGPAVALGMLLAKRHLVESLMAGSLVTAVVGIGLGLFGVGELLYLDRESFIARGLLLEGMERGIGRKLVANPPPPARAEWWSFGAVSAAVLLTTHSVVAILGVGELVRETGEAAGVSAYRRANILDVTVCTYPFLLPFFIPTILASSMTAGGAEGMPRIAPLEVGLLNFHSWALLAILLLAITTGFGRREGASK